MKYNSDGSIERLKACLFAKGFTHYYGIDYQETFAPLAKLNTICVLSVAANLDGKISTAIRQECFSKQGVGRRSFYGYSLF